MCALRYGSVVQSICGYGVCGLAGKLSSSWNMRPGKRSAKPARQRWLGSPSIRRWAPLSPAPAHSLPVQTLTCALLCPCYYSLGLAVHGHVLLPCLSLFPRCAIAWHVNRMFCPRHLASQVSVLLLRVSACDGDALLSVAVCICSSLLVCSVLFVYAVPAG